MCLEDVQVVAYEVPLIDTRGGSATVVDNDEAARLESGSYRSSGRSAAGELTSNDGGIASVRGARPNSSVYYVDGITVEGNWELPQSVNESDFRPFRGNVMEKNDKENRDY
ncbi:MAG: hypothetical protein HRT71_19490 [Flavobacteriales bacterium]|nr:hypothetical protein [Flavobacteriales bacterium]